MANAPRLLVVEDETPIRQGLIDVFVFHGFEVDSTGDGHEGLRKALSGRYDLVLLDIMLPGLNGYDICNRVREQDRDQPIIMLTAKTSDDDIIRGLTLGADDYVAKPFHFAELLARIRAHLRRTRRTDAVVRVGDVSLDPRTRAVTRRDRPIQLTPREYELLELFLRHPGEVLSKNLILDRLWGYAFDDNLVEVYVGYLRRKLGNPPVVETLRGAGYVFRGQAG